jgi:hypothetical protein
MPENSPKKIVSISVLGAATKRGALFRAAAKMYRTYWVGRMMAHIPQGIALSLVFIVLGGDFQASAQPVQEVPEEVLRAEIYTDARSPVDGRLLTAAEYIEESEQIEAANIPPRLLVSERVQKLIELLRLRKLIRQVIPFF